MHDNTLQQTEVQNSTALVDAADSIEDDAFNATAADEKTSHTQIQHRIINNGMVGESLGNTDIQHCTSSDMKPASTDVVSSYHTDVHDDTLRHTEDTLDTEREAIEDEVWKFGPLRLEGVSEQDHGMRSAEPVLNSSETAGAIATGSETGIHTNITDRACMVILCNRLKFRIPQPWLRRRIQLKMTHLTPLQLMRRHHILRSNTELKIMAWVVIHWETLTFNIPQPVT